MLNIIEIGQVRRCLHVTHDPSLPQIVWSGEQGVILHENAIVVAGIHVPGHDQLPVVAQALGCLGLLFGTRQGRQQQRRQDGNNGDHHQQLDQSEGLRPVVANCNAGLLFAPPTERSDRVGAEIWPFTHTHEFRLHGFAGI